MMIYHLYAGSELGRKQLIHTFDSLDRIQTFLSEAGIGTVSPMTNNETFVATVLLMENGRSISESLVEPMDRQESQMRDSFFSSFVFGSDNPDGFYVQAEKTRFTPR